MRAPLMLALGDCSGETVGHCEGVKLPAGVAEEQKVPIGEAETVAVFAGEAERGALCVPLLGPDAVGQAVEDGVPLPLALREVDTEGLADCEGVRVGVTEVVGQREGLALALEQGVEEVDLVGLIEGERVGVALGDTLALRVEDCESEGDAEALGQGVEEKEVVGHPVPLRLEVAVGQREAVTVGHLDTLLQPLTERVLHGDEVLVLVPEGQEEALMLGDWECEEVGEGRLDAEIDGVGVELGEMVPLLQAVGLRVKEGVRLGQGEGLREVIGEREFDTEAVTEGEEDKEPVTEVLKVGLTVEERDTVGLCEGEKVSEAVGVDLSTPLELGVRVAEPVALWQALAQPERVELGQMDGDVLMLPLPDMEFVTEAEEQLLTMGVFVRVSVGIAEKESVWDRVRQGEEVKVTLGETVELPEREGVGLVEGEAEGLREREEHPVPVPVTEAVAQRVPEPVGEVERVGVSVLLTLGLADALAQAEEERLEEPQALEVKLPPTFEPEVLGVLLSVPQAEVEGVVVCDMEAQEVLEGEAGGEEVKLGEAEAL